MPNVYSQATQAKCFDLNVKTKIERNINTYINSNVISRRGEGKAQAKITLYIIVFLVFICRYLVQSKHSRQNWNLKIFTFYY